MTEERRRSHRVKVPLDVAVESDGSVWQGKTVHLSHGGVKVALPADGAKLPVGTGVQLRFALPGTQPPISVVGIVWRREPTSLILLFLDLNNETSSDSRLSSKLSRPKRLRLLG